MPGEKPLSSVAQTSRTGSAGILACDKIQAGSLNYQDFKFFVMVNDPL